MSKLYPGTKRMAIYKNLQIDCSVIIPSYNSARTIHDCLTSILDQKTDLEYEVLVADSSEDGTPLIILTHYPSVRLIQFSERTDPGTARNAAVRQSRGKILLFTDSDCIVAPDWLESMVKEHQQLCNCRHLRF